jgi:hypothetical protein
MGDGMARWEMVWGSGGLFGRVNPSPIAHLPSPIPSPIAHRRSPIRRRRYSGDLPCAGASAPLPRSFMTVLRSTVLCAVLAVLGVVVGAHALSDPPADTAAVLARVRAAIRTDEELQQDFTYIEERRDVKVSKLGKVTLGPVRRFQVFPADGDGDTYKRLIAVDGVPLAPEELARRDADHERDLRAEQSRRARESASARRERLETKAEERRRREAILDDALAVYEGTSVTRTDIDGSPVLALTVKPRESARVSTREGRWMKHFAGTIWVSEADHQLVRLDMRAIDDVTIGWGIVGRLHEGTRIIASRRLIHGVWLPVETSYSASGRTLLFRPFAISATTRYSEYNRVSR